MGIPLTKQELKFAGFPDWIQKRFGIDSTQSWSKIIIFYSEDERAALDKFFELWDEFLNQQQNQK
jgi:hypothetical protein